MLNVILFLSTYIIGVLASFTINPIYAFVVYQLVYFFNPVGRWWGYKVPDIPYSMIIVLTMFLLALKYKSKNSIIKTPHFKWLYFTIFLYAIAYSYAIFPSLHLESLILYFKLGIIITIAFKLCDSQKKLDLVLWAYIFGSLYVSWIAFQVGRNSGDRVEGIGTVDAPDANGIAAAIAPSLILTFFYFWKFNNIKLKFLFAIAGVFIANALVLINSRGSFLAAAAGFLYFFMHLYFSKLKRKNQKTTVILLVIIGLSGFFYIADESFINRITGIKSQNIENTEKESASTRVHFWIASWELAKDKPFGAGFKAFNYYSDIYLPQNINTGSNRSRDVHSTWFTALSEIGYLGFISFFLLIYTSFMTFNKCKKKLHNNIDEYYKVVAMQSALLSYAVSMTFISVFRSEILHWLILFSMVSYNIYILQPKTNK